MILKEEFKLDMIAALGRQKISTAAHELLRVSKDETHGLAGTCPDLVIFPETHEDVVKIAQVCTKHSLPMTPRGAGTGKSGGCVPVQGGALVDFSHFNKIISIDETDLIAVVEPGVVLAEFQRAVCALDLFYPPDPASLEWCTLGGNVAENAGGPCAVKYGVTKDYLLGLRIVLSDGRSFRVGKNTIKGVTGLDLVSLMCGSEGILAFITEITVRLLPKPKFTLASLLWFSARQSALVAVSKIRNWGGAVKCIEFMDALSVNALRTMGVIDDWPKDVGALLLVELDGNDHDQLIGTLEKIAPAASGESYLGAIVATDEKQRQRLWAIRRKLSEATKTIAKHKVSEDIVVPLSQMNPLLDEVEQIAARHSIRTCAFGHAGDGNLHLQIFFDDEKGHQSVLKLLGEVFKATLRRKGTLSGEHGIGIAKQPYLQLEQEEGLIELQRQLKAAFDPLGLLNPGKFL